MSEDIIILNSVFEDTKKRSCLLGALLERVDNRDMRQAIIGQISEYDNINKSAGEEICLHGITPKSKHPIKDKLSVWGAGMSAAANPTPSHIAKIITSESDNGVVNTVRVMRECQNSSPTAYNLARRLVNCEEESTRRMKDFL